MSSDNTGSWLSRIEITSVFLALMSALLFLRGDAIHRGFLMEFGIMHHLMPLSPTETMITGARGAPQDVLGGFFIVIGNLLELALISAVLCGLIVGIRYALKTRSWNLKAVTTAANPVTSSPLGPRPGAPH